MKIIILFMLAVAVIVECDHTFMGTNVNVPLLYRHTMELEPQTYFVSTQEFSFERPEMPYSKEPIKGILAYDVTNTDASANVTQGGLGYNHVTIVANSAAGKKLHFDIYLYA